MPAYHGPETLGLIDLVHTPNIFGAKRVESPSWQTWHTFEMPQSQPRRLILPMFISVDVVHRVGGSETLRRV